MAPLRGGKTAQTSTGERREHPLLAYALARRPWYSLRLTMFLGAYLSHKNYMRQCHSQCHPPVRGSPYPLRLIEGKVYKNQALVAGRNRLTPTGAFSVRRLPELLGKRLSELVRLALDTVSC